MDTLKKYAALCYVVAAIWSAFLCTPALWGQANVPENLETALIYVDVAHGSDSNPGTAVQPLRTITKAVSVAIANNAKHTGTRVTIEPGTYREGNIILYSTSSQTSAPITLQAATAGTVVMSGADAWTGWKQSSSNAQVFSHSWPYQWGMCSQLYGGELPILRRREMVFVNGHALTQVLAPDQLMAGTFYVDETHKVVSLWPPSGTNMSSAIVEVATRPTLIEIHGKTNWVLRGIAFQAANSCRQVQEAVQFTGGSSNILIDTDKFQWNNAGGLGMNRVYSVTVRNSAANHNGEVGLVSRQSKNSLWQSDEGSYDNWRGEQAASFGVSANGAKFMSVHSGTFSAVKAIYNIGKGVHWDTDNIDVQASNLFIAQNYWSAVQIEATQGPITISNSRLCNNDRAGRIYDAGVNLLDVSYVTLTGNAIVNNQDGQIGVSGRSNGISVTNWETNATTTVFNQKFTATQNTLVSSGGAYGFRDPSQASDWTLFVSTLASDYNVWWNSSKSNVFTVPVPTSGTDLSLSGWRTVTHQDPHSSFAAPTSSSATSCSVTPDGADFWLLVDNPTPSVSRGSRTSVLIRTLPFGGLSGALQLRQSGISHISGATAGWGQTSLTAGNSVSLSIFASSSTPTGTYPVTIIAGNGSLARTVTFMLTVN